MRIETHVMPHEDGGTDELDDGWEHLADRRSTRHHVVRDAGQVSNKVRNRLRRVYKCAPGAGDLARVYCNQRNLSDAIASCDCTCCFDVDDGKGQIPQI